MLREVRQQERRELVTGIQRVREEAKRQEEAVRT
jgi:hypothetical protein